MADDPRPPRPPGPDRDAGTWLALAGLGMLSLAFVGLLAMIFVPRILLLLAVLGVLVGAVVLQYVVWGRRLSRMLAAAEAEKDSAERSPSEEA